MKRFNQYITSFVVSLGGFSLGVCLGWNSSSSELLINYVNGDATALGLIGGIINIGILIGLISLPLILKVFSRTGAMILGVPILFIGWSCITFAGQTVPLLLIGRTLCGYSGTFSILSALYISEISDKHIRGKLLSIYQLMVNIGIMYSYTIGYLTSNEKTIWLYSLICGLTTAPLSFVTLIPETPIYHLNNKNESRAKISLKYFRGDNFDGLDNEFEELKNLISIKESNREVTRSFITSFGIILVHQMSGITPFIFYTLTILKAGGSGDISPSAETLILGFSQIIGSIIALILIDIIGRKVLLIVSSSMMGSALILLGWFFKIEDEDPEYSDKFSWLSLTCMTIYFMGFNMGVGPISWVYIGEIFPYNIKFEGGLTASILNCLLSLSLTLSFGEIIGAIGQSNTMWIFAIFCLSGTIFTIFYIKETKMKSLIEIHDNSDTTESTRL